MQVASKGVAVKGIIYYYTKIGMISQNIFKDPAR